MPMNKKWSFGLVLTIIALIAGGFSPATADSHIPGEVYTAPAPTKLDASGTDQDQYYIPQVIFDHPQYGAGMYRVNGKPKDEGWHSTKGAPSITVTADWGSGTWTFDFTSDDLGTEAKNVFSAKVGMCNPDLGRRSVTAFVTNTDDDTNLPVPLIEVVPDRPTSQLPTGAAEAKNIQDGETRPMPLEKHVGGLFPGRWVLDFYRDENYDKRVARVTIWVSACGDVSPPAGDQPPGEVAKPKASVRQLMCWPPRVKVTFNNRASTRPVTFKLLRSGKLVKSVRLSAGETKRVFKKAKPRSRVKVVAGGKVLVVKKIKPYRHRRC